MVNKDSLDNNQWQIRCLEEVVDILDGMRKPIKKEDRVNGEIPYYGATGIIDWVKDYIFNEPLILVGEDGENLRSRVLPMAFKIQGKAWVNNHAHVLRPYKNVDIDYLTYYLDSISYEDYITGSAQPKLNQKQLRKVKVLLPHVREQQKVASILSSVDKSIEKTTAIIEQTEEVKKGLMQQLFTKGIGHTKFKKTEIGKVPEAWGVKKVEEIGTVGTGGTPKRDEPKNYGGSIPWIKTTEIKYNSIMKAEEYITEYALGNSAAKLYPVGTVLLAMYGQGVTRGRCAILGIDAATNQACAAIITKQEMINKFLYYVLELNYENLRNLGHGSNQSNLNTRFVKSFLVPVPPIHEQENIIKIISSIESKLMIEIRNLEELKKIKIGLMQSLLTGKVCVEVDEAEVTQV